MLELGRSMSTGFGLPKFIWVFEFAMLELGRSMLRGFRLASGDKSLYCQIIFNNLPIANYVINGYEKVMNKPRFII